MEFNHIPVLKEECINNLNIKKDGIYVDGTLGGAGHSKCVLEKLNNKGLLIGIDRDEEALKAAKKNLAAFSNVKYVHGNHENIKEILDELGIEGVDGILLDLGVSSYQLDNKSRGFSYMEDARLDMRMDQTQKITAEYVINTYDEEKLTDIFFKYGEEKYSKRIAKKIVEFRKQKRIETTVELVDLIKQAMPNSALREKQHPAKRVFQALRIEVNGELIKLKEGIKQAVYKLKSNGRLEVITFHSLEDRIVKETFEELQGKCTCPKDFPICVCNFKSYGRIVNKKPYEANEQELLSNPRARSAKLRIFEKEGV